MPSRPARLRPGTAGDRSRWHTRDAIPALPLGEDGGAPDSLGDDVGKALRDLNRIHQKLTEAVALATPGSIRETEGVI